MSEYRITFARSARKELQFLDNAAVARIIEKIESLADKPRPVRCVKLRGKEDLWRLRVGAYRVIYSVDDPKKWVDIIAVRHRKDAYR